MSEKPLLLSSAKSGILVTGNRQEKNWPLYTAAAIGMLVVIVGAADVASRIAHAAFGNNAALVSFAPAIALLNPDALNSFSAATSTAPLTPARLFIPSIGVNAAVEQVGNNAAGAMGAPSNFTDVAWYALGSKPGEPGNAVIDGHVNNALTTSGVFSNLSKVNIGDVITVADQSGRTLTYRVREVQEYSATSTPATDIFTRSGPSQLVLYTCDGEWVSSAHEFDKRLVVFASLQ